MILHNIKLAIHKQTIKRVQISDNISPTNIDFLYLFLVTKQLWQQVVPETNEAIFKHGFLFEMNQQLLVTKSAHIKK